MLRNIATLALAAAIFIAAVVGGKIYAEKGRIAQNEANSAANEKAARQMALNEAKLEADKAASEARAQEERAKVLAEENERKRLKLQEKAAEIEANKIKAAEEKEVARKTEALSKANQEMRAAEAEKAKTAKYEAEKAAKELEIATKAENKAKLEAQKAEDEAVLIKYNLEDLLATKEQYETLIQDNETLRAELKELIEANKPEMSVKDLMNLEEEARPGQTEGLGEAALARGEAALKKAEQELSEREEKRRASVQAETLEKLEKLLQESVKNGEVIDAEFYLKIIKGVK